MINIKQELDVKMVLLQNITDADMVTARGHVSQLTAAVGARPADACLTILNGLDTGVLSKIYDQIKGVKNVEYKISVIAKAVFEVDYAGLVTKENHIKNLKEFQKGAFDLSAKLMVTSQFMSEEGVTSWQSLEKEINDIIKQRAFNAGVQQGRAAVEADGA